MMEMFAEMVVVHRSKERRGIYIGGESRAGALMVGAAAPTLTPSWLKFSHSLLSFVVKQNKCSWWWSWMVEKRRW